ncbi:MAG: hypothetical protein B0A82_14655 [Alkalinema sp. CACIAM 70d]|nr:MAG: hypothetical protein B0A82_14655 [Alkalinema sp. CACIAM 70d]
MALLEGIEATPVSTVRMIDAVKGSGLTPRWRGNTTKEPVSQPAMRLPGKAFLDRRFLAMLACCVAMRTR